MARALGKFQDETAAAALAPLAKGDPSYFVEGEANLALGATKQPVAFDILPGRLGKASHLDIDPGELLHGSRAPARRPGVAHAEGRRRPGGQAPGAHRPPCGPWPPSPRGGTPIRTEIREELERYLTDANFFAKFGALLSLEVLDEASAARCRGGRALPRERRAPALQQPRRGPGAARGQVEGRGDHRPPLGPGEAPRGQARRSRTASPSSRPRIKRTARPPR